MPFACSIVARLPKALWRLWYSVKLLQRDVDRALQLLGRAFDDVGEHAAPGGLMDVRRVVGVEQRDHRARRLPHDLADQLKRVVGGQAEPDDRNIGALPRGRRSNLLDVDLTRDHVVAKCDHHLREKLQPVALLVRDQNP
jgi:hypothetical protein